MDPDDVPSPGSFPATRHSVIERIRDTDPDTRRAAFGDLVDGYWKPVYKHLRITWRMDAEEASDMTQAFFADAYQKSWLERYEPSKARFRTFVRVCADRFVMNARQAASRLKRGGAAIAVPLDFAGAEREVAAIVSSARTDPEALFHHEFVRALFEKTVRELRDDYESRGRFAHFTLFERYDLAPEAGVSYAQLAAELGLSTHQVTNTLAQVRRRFRERALATLRGLCGSDEDYRGEARELFGVDVA